MKIERFFCWLGWHTVIHWKPDGGHGWCGQCIYCDKIVRERD